MIRVALCVGSLAAAFACGAARAERLPDPTRPPDYVPGAAPVVEVPKEVIDYRLSAVKFSGAARWAIINGERVAQGDEIGPARVIEIKPSAVLLDYEGESLTLELLGQPIKNPPAAGKR